MEYLWQYDETIQVGTDYLDEKEVQAYDLRMQRLRDVKEEIDAMVKTLSISKDSLVWEIGTGTGECAIALSRICRQVFATDVSHVMLRYAEEKAKTKNARNIDFRIGGFLSGFQPPLEVDFIISQIALHHLPDFWKNQGLYRITKRLKTEGKLYLKDVVFPSGIDDYDSYFDEIIEQMRTTAGEKMAHEMIVHIKEEYSTMDWILEGMIERNGLKIIHKLDHGFMPVYVCEKKK